MSSSKRERTKSALHQSRISSFFSREEHSSPSPKQDSSVDLMKSKFHGEGNSLRKSPRRKSRLSLSSRKESGGSTSGTVTVSRTGLRKSSSASSPAPLTIHVERRNNSSLRGKPDTSSCHAAAVPTSRGSISKASSSLVGNEEVGDVSLHYSKNRKYSVKGNMHCHADNRGSKQFNNQTILKNLPIASSAGESVDDDILSTLLEEISPKKLSSDPVSSPDLIPGTPPDQLWRRNGIQHHTFSSKRKIFPFEKFEPHSTLKKKKAKYVLENYSSSINLNGAPLVHIEFDSESVKSDPTPFANNVKPNYSKILENSSTSPINAVSTIKDDEGVRSILPHMSSPKHSQISGKQDLTSCNQNVMFDSHYTSKVSSRYDRQSAGKVMEPSLEGKQIGIHKSSRTPSLSIPLRRSPRKLLTNPKLSDSLKEQSQDISIVSSQGSLNLESGIVAKEVKNDVIDEDLRDLHLVFGNESFNLHLNQFNELCEDCLDLHQAQVCQVTSLKVSKQNREAILHLKGLDNGLTAVCKVRGCWLNSPVFEGDVISIEATKVNGEWLLDDKAGFIVLNPDLLISGTAVVGSLFCARRSVLSSLYRGIDSDSSIMVVGSIIHELLQMTLLEEKYTETDIMHIAEQLITTKSCISMLYASKMKKVDILKEISEFVPRIAAFMSTFCQMKKQDKNQVSSCGSAISADVFSVRAKQPDSSNWDGRIIGIRDIEETLWEPRLGIKGMVDVSVDVEDSFGQKKSMPLELKTGRASFSAEHKGQVNLYSMMMSRMGMNVMSGLLLYLREGKIREVTLSDHEKKDLIRLRNTLSEYLLPRSPVMNDVTGKFPLRHLPEPINFASACQKCPYVVLCSVHLKSQGVSKLSSNHPMVSLSSSATQHLTQDHIDYIAHWAGLLQVEDMERIKSSKIRHFWRFSPQEREKNKQAIVNLKLHAPGVLSNGKYCHVFCREDTNIDSRNCGLSVGDYIIVSTDKRLAVDHGHISALSQSSVTVLTNKPLFPKHGKDRFYIDQSDSNSALVFNFTNLGCLLDDNKQANRLRKLIIDRIDPTYGCFLSHDLLFSCEKIFERLNKKQQEAVTLTLKADDYLLIKGLPGTGKTATLVALVQVLARAGLSVLITSHTHSAIDNLLLRLKAVGLQFMRLGSDGRIHSELRPYSESTLTTHCKTPEDLDNVFSNQRIVGVTCLGAGHAMLSGDRMFDVCLVDESTQVSQPSILRILLRAHRFVLIGDPHQLPPVVRSNQAKELGLSESLFSRLESPKSTVTLNVNYRMNYVITNLANSLTYGGELTCGSDEVSTATLCISKTELCSSLWLLKSLSPDIDDSVIFLDTTLSSKTFTENNALDEESACSNAFEVLLVMQLLNALLEKGIEAKEIGVMAPYRAQVALIARTVEDTTTTSRVEVNTVDQFQGRDKQVILYSCTRRNELTYNPKEREILNDQRRLTVAITRAKMKLILIGHAATLRLYTPFKKLLSSLSEAQIVPVYDN